MGAAPVPEPAPDAKAAGIVHGVALLDFVLGQRLGLAFHQRGLSKPRAATCCLARVRLTDELDALHEAREVARSSAGAKKPATKGAARPPAKKPPADLKDPFGKGGE